ncbi:MAG: hypothetical protein WC277_03935 [Bacilli bacterium]
MSRGTFERRVERLEQIEQQQNKGPSIVIINEGEPVPAGVEHVIVDDIRRRVEERI